MALRVLPSLSLAVTEDAVRKQKRIVMFVPGLVAFGIYRLAKHLVPLADPLVLLSVSSLVAVVTALAAYRVGRSASWATIVREDGTRLLGWLAGWIGAFYGLQLSLLVLALLWLVGYDYLQHPDGPAMMAIIISCTSVARDAFEIGHVRNVALMGKPVPTFPNGVPLRAMLREHMAQAGSWGTVGLVLGAVAASLGLVARSQQLEALIQVAAVTLFGGGIALCAYLSGLRPSTPWAETLRRTAPGELLKYWWWPGMAFASTYYLVVLGGLLFILRQPGVPAGGAVVGGAVVAAMMGLYGYYLGHRRQVEDAQIPQLTEGMLRCPFVMGMLGKSSNMGAAIAAARGSKV
jgi:hypothetical protein